MNNLRTTHSWMACVYGLFSRVLDKLHFLYTELESGSWIWGFYLKILREPALDVAELDVK